MAWSTPKTFTAGAVLPAADLNTNVRDNTNFLFGLVPTGTVLTIAQASIPTNFLACDGAAVSRSTYATLFATIGTTFGAGNGTTTFNVPDLRGRAAIGVGTGSGLSARTLGQTVGEETHLLTIAEMPSHDHPYNEFTSGGVGSDFPVQSPAGQYGSQNTGATGGGGAHNNMQPSLVLTFIIKT